MAKNRLKFISKYSHNNLQRAYLRTIASGIKGYILNRNSKVPIKALKDFIKDKERNMKIYMIGRDRSHVKCGVKELYS